MIVPQFTPKQIAAYVDHRRSIFYVKTDEPVSISHRELVEAECRGEKVLRRYAKQSGVDIGTWVESMVAQRATRAGVRVANVSTFDGGDQVGQDEKGTYQTLWKINGVPLAEVIDTKRRHHAYADLGRQLAKLHSVETMGAGFIHPSDDRLCGMQNAWWDHINTKTLDHLDYLKDNVLIDLPVGPARCAYALGARFMQCAFHVPLTLLHGDLSDRNVLIQTIQQTEHSCVHLVTLIDWEDAIIGDPVYDLANWATFHDAEEVDWSILFDAYYEGQLRWQYRPWDFDLRFWTYYLRISLSKLVQLHRYGHSDLTRARARIDRALAALNA